MGFPQVGVLRMYPKILYNPFKEPQKRYPYFRKPPIHKRCHDKSNRGTAELHQEMDIQRMSGKLPGQTDWHKWRLLLGTFGSAHGLWLSSFVIGFNFSIGRLNTVRNHSKPRRTTLFANALEVRKSVLLPLQIVGPQ